MTTNALQMELRAIQARRTVLLNRHNCLVDGMVALTKIDPEAAKQLMALISDTLDEEEGEVEALTRRILMIEVG